MTITAQTAADNRTSAVGNGVTTSFTFGKPFTAQADLVVNLVLVASPFTATLQVLNTDYTISGTADAQGRYGSGANVVFSSAPSSLFNVVIYADPAVAQGLDLVENDPLPAEQVELALDKCALQDRRARDILARVFRLLDSSVSTGSLTVEPIASQYLGFDASKNLITIAATAGGAVVSTFMATVLDDTTAPAARLTLGFPAIAAKGDLLVGTAADTLTKLAVGTDGQALRAKSSATPGVAWESPTDAIGAGRNIAAKNNAGTPNTKLDITADELVLKNATGGTLLASTVNVTIDFGTVGANGIDASTQVLSTWYYGWIIGKLDGTIAGLGSASATAPTMPTGYTFKALVTAVRSDGSVHFLKYRQFGNEIYYEGSNSVLGSGAASSETAVALSVVVPPIALAAKIIVKCLVSKGGGAAANTTTIRLVTGTNYAAISQECNGNTAHNDLQLDIPNLGQSVSYLNTTGATPDAANTSIEVIGFKLPGGGE